MQGLLKYITPAFGKDNISDCASQLRDLKKLKMTYPPEHEKELVINLKA